MRTFLIGACLTTACWALAWTRFGVLSEYSFFPLWLGYILTVNGLSELVTGSSLLKSMRRFVAPLFLSSIPLWWFFEAVDNIVQNWHYEFLNPVSRLHYILQATVNFSIVVPAVLSTGFLFYQIAHKQDWLITTQPFKVDSRRQWVIILLGLVGFALLPIFPSEAFPLVWVAPILVLEPLAYLFGLPSLLRELEKGRSTLLLAVMSGTLFTGMWWELWNYYALPKWVYTVPYVGFWKIFEMPLLGYLGYPFFGIVVFSWASLCFSTLFRINLVCVFDNSSEGHCWLSGR